MEDFISFKKMITPAIVQFLFWIGVLVLVISGIVVAISGLVRLSFGGLLYGILMIILGPLLLRIQAELILLAFKIYDRLGEIHDSLRASK